MKRRGEFPLALICKMLERNLEDGMSRTSKVEAKPKRDEASGDLRKADKIRSDHSFMID